MWQQWLNGVLGLWIILFPLLGFQSSNTTTWTLVITGAVIAVLGFWGAKEGKIA